MKAGKFQVCGCLHPPRLSVLQLHEIREVAQEVLLGFPKEGEQPAYLAGSARSRWGEQLRFPRVCGFQLDRWC